MLLVAIIELKSVSEPAYFDDINTIFWGLIKQRPLKYAIYIL